MNALLATILILTIGTPAPKKFVGTTLGGAETIAISTVSALPNEIAQSSVTIHAGADTVDCWTFELEIPPGSSLFQALWGQDVDGWAFDFTDHGDRVEVTATALSGNEILPNTIAELALVEFLVTGGPPIVRYEWVSLGGDIEDYDE